MSTTINRLPDPILVVGGYGYRNVGDEAILAGLLAKLGDRRVTVVSRDPDATLRLHGVPAIGITAAGIALLRHRTVVIGGGGLFGRDMGTIGRLLPLYGLAAAALGRRVVVDGVDLDAHLTRSARALVPRLMRRAATVTVRDRRSVAILRDWGVSADFAPDLSDWMPMAPVAEGRALLLNAGIDTGRPVVGLALTGVVPTIADAAAAAIEAAMDALPDTQFCFIPMSRHPRAPSHDDLVLAQRLRSARPRLAVLETLGHPAAVLAAFSQLSAVVSMRYHGMRFAERVGVPLVPIAYAEKNMRWLDERGLQAVPATAEKVTETLRTILTGEELAAKAPERVAS